MKRLEDGIAILQVMGTQSKRLILVSVFSYLVSPTCLEPNAEVARDHLYCSLPSRRCCIVPKVGEQSPTSRLEVLVTRKTTESEPRIVVVMLFDLCDALQLI